ncbi:MAG TPA: DUF6069 family protein [Rubrobacter sp.]|nr:DUF6069 family protein [Rubrobacter sp.]
MEGTAPESSRLKRVLAGPLLRVGALATLLSTSANVVVLAGASSLFGPVVIPPDEMVTIGQVMGASTAGAVGAAVVFAAICRFTRRTIAVFCGLAVVGLLLSFIPIALVGATGSSAGTLALMHVVAAVTDVGLLTRLGRKG